MICMVYGQGLPVQLICHKKTFNNFQIDDASRYFGVWLWELVYLLILVCSFQWCVLFLCLAKLYRSCPVRDKYLLCTSHHADVAIKLLLPKPQTWELNISRGNNYTSVLLILSIRKVLWWSLLFFCWMITDKNHNSLNVSASFLFNSNILYILDLAKTVPIGIYTSRLYI